MIRSSTVKEFLTRTFDDYRPPYGRCDQRFARECVFIGTTNETDFLRDSTGNRRFLPIVAEHVDLDFVREHRDAIWGEAAALEAAGALHWLEDEAAADEARAEHVVEDAWHHKIAAYLRGREWVTPAEVYLNAIDGSGIGGGLVRFGRHEQLRICDTLRRLGCTQGRPHRLAPRAWRAPPHLAAAETPARPPLYAV
jgi:putative DNA primase/helicase